MSKIFVFGSNLAGRHGAGAAKAALEHHGAIYGKGVGHYGNSYALPTKDENLKTLSLEDIQGHVTMFLIYATDNPELEFYVTKIGCGLAGYKPIDVAMFFKDAPKNCELPKEFVDIINRYKALDELTQLSQEMGLYDDDWEWMKHHNED